MDRDYMKIALKLAEKGCGFTSPNPMVGAVIVKNERIIGQGWHEKFGHEHAERNALNACSESPEGATMYVTLEPCCHHGKQPPCVNAILKAGIKRVVIGSSDPNPLVGGRGIKILREHGISVTEHVLQDDCDRLNEVFFHYIQTGRPFVALKYAMTMDGKIATGAGLSKWVTGEAARRHVALQRHRHTAIMAGVNTILSDNPLLTCHMDGGSNPIRIVCDTALRTPPDSNIVSTADQVPTLIATCCRDEKQYFPYEKAGCRIITVNKKDGHVDLTQLMDILGNEQIDSILLEGGGTLSWSALSCGIVQKVYAYIAPKIFGGQAAKTPVEGAGVFSPSDAFQLTNCRFSQLGDDFLIESEVR